MKSVGKKMKKPSFLYTDASAQRKEGVSNAVPPLFTGDEKSAGLKGNHHCPTDVTVRSRSGLLRMVQPDDSGTEFIAPLRSLAPTGSSLQQKVLRPRRPISVFVRCIVPPVFGDVKQQNSHFSPANSQKCV